MLQINGLKEGLEDQMDEESKDRKWCHGINGVLSVVFYATLGGIMLAHLKNAHSIN